MRILVTAGPTREFLDPVRFLTNGSTGIMGYACAEAARRRKHQVTLISGPVSLSAPKGVQLINVVTAADMADAVGNHFDTCDCVIMTAAVSDYRPKVTSPAKLRKTPGELTLQLERTTDILATLGATKTHQLLIGFALQDRAARRSARDKLTTKNLDAIILNGPAAMGADRIDAELLCHGGKWQSLPSIRKAALATRIIRLAERLADA